MSSLTRLGAIAHARYLDVRCSRCTRAGRLSIARLIREKCADASVADAWAGLNADCPRRDARGAGEACDLYAPELGAMIRGE